MNYVLVVDDSLVDRRLAGHLLEGSSEYHVEYAGNGIEALELLDARLPLAVVTDLQMPEMDGMQLVAAIRRRFPAVPVILMTAHGSEDIALQALTVGAADYVPKSQLVAELRKSVADVLAITSGKHGHQRLWHCLRSEELQYELESDVRLIAPLVDELQQLAGGLGIVDQADRVRLAKSLTEALHNAIRHGNQGLPPDAAAAASPPPWPPTETDDSRREPVRPCARHVYVHALFSPHEARFTIRDEGPGFDVSCVPDVTANPVHLTGDGGRGLVLVHLFMDEVSFNSSGTEITLVKRACRPAT